VLLCLVDPTYADSLLNCWWIGRFYRWLEKVIGTELKMIAALTFFSVLIII